MPHFRDEVFEPYLDQLRSLSFVRNLDVRPATKSDIDAIVRIQTTEGTYRLACELKQTFLDKTLTNAIVSLASRAEHALGMKLLLLSPYVPRPTGERLAEGGVNFVDRHGNMHLALEGRYYVFVLGKRKQGSTGIKERLGPATVQVILTYLAENESVSWPVRTLAERAGVSKSLAAGARNRLIAEGVLRKTPQGKFRIVDRELLAQKWLSGYTSALRPRLVLGTYRSPLRDPEEFLQQVRLEWQPRFGKWATTGAAGAYALQHFYRGYNTTLFVEKSVRESRESFRLLSDPRGPVTFLKTFGPIVYWHHPSPIPIAHPWLIYAELLQEDDPRSREAAEQIRDAYLK